MATDSKGNGTLYVVGTPIGNLQDITFRAISTLRSVALIAAEDTRHTGKLLQHFQITTPQTSFHAHNWKQRIPELLTRLQRGESVALVSDAGMPGISDPGYELVEACTIAGVPVVAIPGPTAAITALCISGLPPQPFVFEGFLPTKGRHRRDRLQQLAREPRTLVLYEAPHRLLATLTDLLEVMEPDRPVAIARELTKQFETVWRGELAAAIAHFTEHPPKGEFTLVLGGRGADGKTPWSETAVEERLRELLRSGLSCSEASRQVAQEAALPKRDVYQRAIDLRDAPEFSPDATPNPKV